MNYKWATLTWESRNWAYTTFNTTTFSSCLNYYSASKISIRTVLSTLRSIRAPMQPYNFASFRFQSDVRQDNGQHRKSSRIGKVIYSKWHLDSNWKANDTHKLLPPQSSYHKFILPLNGTVTPRMCQIRHYTDWLNRNTITNTFSKFFLTIRQ